MEEVLKFILGDESVNKNNAAIEDDSLAEYVGTTAVDVLTDTDKCVEDSSSEQETKFPELETYFSLLDYFCTWY